MHLAAPAEIRFYIDVTLPVRNTLLPRGLPHFYVFHASDRRG